MPAPLSVALFPRKHARHAKASKAGPVLVAGGMTAALAVTDAALLSSPAAAGGSVAQFERLAQCESGGNWSINTGNGYYGGIQFNLATWRGLGFGGYPHQASKSTQIAAGQKLHSQRGWAPWPACSRKLGLSGDGGYSGSGSVSASSRTSAAPVRTAAERRAAAERASRSRALRVAAQQAAAAKAAAAQAAAVKAAAARLAAARVAAIRLETAVERELLLHPMPGATEAALALPTTPQFDGKVITVADRQVKLAAVETWQRQMESRGWHIDVDGHFGPQSARIAALFAREKGAATVPGTVDQQLWDLAWTAPVTS